MASRAPREMSEDENEQEAKRVSFTSEVSKLQAEAENLGRIKKMLSEENESEKKRINQELMDMRAQTKREIDECEKAVVSARAKQSIAENEADEAIKLAETKKFESNKSIVSADENKIALADIVSKVAVASKELSRITTEVIFQESKRAATAKERDRLSGEAVAFVAQKNILSKEIESAATERDAVLSVQNVAIKNKEKVEAEAKQIEVNMFTAKNALASATLELSNMRAESARIKDENEQVIARCHLREMALGLLEKNIDAKIDKAKRDGFIKYANSVAEEKGIT